MEVRVAEHKQVPLEVGKQVQLEAGKQVPLEAGTPEPVVACIWELAPVGVARSLGCGGPHMMRGWGQPRVGAVHIRSS